MSHFLVFFFGVVAYCVLKASIASLFPDTSLKLRVASWKKVGVMKDSTGRGGVAGESV